MPLDREPDKSQNIEQGPNSITMRDALVSATFASNRALSSSINTIVLGSLAAEAEKLMELTRSHPQHVEYGKHIYVTPRHTILIPQIAVEGVMSKVQKFGGEVALAARIVHYGRRDGPKENRQDKFIGVGMHTHSNFDLPPSPQDIGRIFLSDDNPMANTAVFVITNTRKPDGSLSTNKYIIFRGDKTPQWSEEQVTQKVNQWQSMINDRVRRHITPFMSIEDQLAINARAQGALLRTLVRNYGLRLFTAVNGSEVAIEATL